MDPGSQQSFQDLLTLAQADGGALARSAKDGDTGTPRLQGPAGVGG